MRLVIVDHPLLADTLAGIRDQQTPSPQFAALVERAALILVADACADLATTPTTVRTPLGDAPASVLSAQPVFVPVLRAGLGMLAPARALLPNAPVGFLGLKRDEETARPHWYLDSLPESLDGTTVILLEPMIATGGTLVEVVHRLVDRGCRQVAIASLICAPQGLAALADGVPDGVAVSVHTAAQDDGLDERHFIFPGLGDAGDRMFGC